MDITMTTQRHPGADRRFSQRILAEPGTVALARAAAEYALRKWELPRHIDAAQLVLSELLTNAVRAAPGRTVGYVIDARDGDPLIEVWDPVLESPRCRVPAEGDESGRGLSMIVVVMAAEWGVRFPAAGGKVVWARLRPAGDTP